MRTIATILLTITLVGCSANPNISLVASSRVGTVEDVRIQLNKGANPNFETANGMMPLHAATFAGKIDVMEALLNAGANIDAANMQGLTPLIVAVNSGRTDTVKFLLDKGADANLSPKPNANPALAAVELPSIEILDLLATYGANLNYHIEEVDYIHPLLVFADDDILFEKLLELGANPDIFIDREKELHLIDNYINKGEFKKIALLIQHGVNPNLKRGPAENTLLHYAVSQSAGAARALVENGADGTIENIDGLSAIRLAELNGLSYVVRIMKGSEPLIQ